VNAFLSTKSVLVTEGQLVNGSGDNKLEVPILQSELELQLFLTENTTDTLPFTWDKMVLEFKCRISGKDIL